MTGSPDYFVRMWEVGRKVDGTSFVTNLAGGATVLSRFRQRARVSGVASRWRDSAKFSCTWVIGTPNCDPSGRPVSMRWILISMLSQEAIRNMDIEAVAILTGALG